jgi:hypothetical protein
MVNKVMDRFMTSGESIQISVDTPRLPAGVYFLVVTSEREREVLPVVVR